MKRPQTDPASIVKFVDEILKALRPQLIQYLCQISGQPRDLVTIAEAARIKGVSRTTIYMYIRRGILPVRAGHFVSITDLLAVPHRGGR